MCKSENPAVKSRVCRHRAMQNKGEKMKNEFKQALEDMQKLILDFKDKYHIEQDDFMKLALQMNKIAMLAPAGTFEGE